MYHSAVVRFPGTARTDDPKEEGMKRQELLDALESMGTATLADLAGVKLKRGRPSFELRSDLIAAILGAIAEKRLSVSVVKRHLNLG